MTHHRPSEPRMTVSIPSRSCTEANSKSARGCCCCCCCCCCAAEGRLLLPMLGLTVLSALALLLWLCSVAAAGTAAFLFYRGPAPHTYRCQPGAAQSPSGSPHLKQREASAAMLQHQQPATFSHTGHTIGAKEPANESTAPHSSPRRPTCNV